MRRLAVAMLVVAAAGAAAPVTAQTAVETRAVDAWVEAFNSRDPTRIVALYAPNAMLWGTTAKTLATTPDEVWDYFKGAGERPNLRVTVQHQRQSRAGDVVIASGSYTFAEVQGGVRSNERPARFTFVFRRDGDRWLIVAHHSSRVPEP